MAVNSKLPLMALYFSPGYGDDGDWTPPSELRGGVCEFNRLTRLCNRHCRNHKSTPKLAIVSLPNPSGTIEMKGGKKNMHPYSTFYKKPIFLVTILCSLMLGQFFLIPILSSQSAMNKSSAILSSRSTMINSPATVKSSKNVDDVESPKKMASKIALVGGQDDDLSIKLGKMAYSVGNISS